jgi:hypothetical protein
MQYVRVPSLCVDAIRELTLSCVDRSYYDHVVDLKILLTAVLSPEQDLLDELYEIIFCNRSFEDRRLILLEELWNSAMDRMKKLPRFEKFAPLFKHDVRVALTSAHYLKLANTLPEAVNLEEWKLYTVSIAYLVDVDLMASPSFNINELPYLREILLHAQQMIGISSWLSSWSDSVTPLAYLLSNALTTPAEIAELNDGEVIELAEMFGFREHMLKLWRENYERIRAVGSNVNSFNVDSILAGLEKLLRI